MSLVVKRDLWLCEDCTIVAVNGDSSGISDNGRVAEVDAGLERIGRELGWMSPNYTIDDFGEASDGVYDFCAWTCDSCGTRLAGSRHRFAILGQGT